MPVIAHDNLRAVARAVLAGMGSTDAEAAEVANHLVEANLKGHDSHGVGMLPLYYKNFADGHLKVNQHAKAVRNDGAIAVFEGNMGHGQVIAREVTDWAISMARTSGVAVAGLREVHHIGRVGTYGEQAVAAGMISFTYVNAITGAPFVAPFRGTDGRMSTNPVCIAMPGPTPETPIVLDFATSKVAMGKVRVAYNEGRQMAEGMLIDKHGNPTTNPGVLWPDRSQGSILPFGEHKGYGLAVICELLAGALVGGGTYAPGTPRRSMVNAMLSIVLDPSRVNDTPVFHDELASFVDWVKASPPRVPDEPVLVAGEPERIKRAHLTANGVTVDDTTWRDILSTAGAIGIGAAKIEKLASGSA